MKKKNKIKEFVKDAIFGSIIGFINGFLGGGGGMVAVPLLKKAKNLDSKKSHATAIAVIFPLTIASSIVYGLTVELNWLNVLILSISVTVGGIAGSFLLKKLSNRTIRIVFACLMLFAGIFMIVKS